MRTRRNRRTTRVQMRVLLLGLTGAEPAFMGWADWLTAAGVPFDAVSLNDLTSPVRFVDESGAAVFQGLIMTEGGLIEIMLEPPERAQLERLERQHALRRLTAYAVPGPTHGLTAAHWSGPLEELEPRLTESGRRVFPYLRRRLPVDPGSWAHLAFPLSPDRFETLVAGPDESALIGIHRHDDGREELVQTFDANRSQAQGQVLRRGKLCWLTRGAYVGLDRNYLSVQIDDVLLANYSWSVERHESDRRPDQSIRMSEHDARYASAWGRARGVRLDLACNGAGSSGYAARSGRDEDPLLSALLTERHAFGWINHTFEHGDLDEVSQAEIEAEIERNLRWARQVGLDLEPGALVTGAHTGLANLMATPPRAENPELAAALRAQRILYLACDASRPYPARRASAQIPAGTPFMVGPAIAVPRHPTTLPHDAATRSQVLDRLRSEKGQAVTTFDEVLETEVRAVFNSIVGNDPRPYYFHQSNLIGGRDATGGESTPALMYSILDAVLDRYSAHIAPGVGLVQPTLGEIGRLLLRQQAWRAIVDLGSISAFTDRTHVTVINNSGTSIDMPLTGATIGEDYAGHKSGWIRLKPGETVMERQTKIEEPSATRAAGR
jgi:hypothetical protein